MISHTYKCIFIHIPKCGGTSIEDIIWPGERTPADLWMGFVTPYTNKYQTGGLQHLLGVQIREEVGEKIFRDYFTFTFVRNPWDKAISQYFYMAKRKDLRDYIGMKENDPFDKYLDLIQRTHHVQWEHQHRFITDTNGNILVDFVGRLENMNADAAYIYKTLGIDATPVHVNATRHQHYSAYYTNESRERIADVYREDIRLLGYTFELLPV